MQFSVLADTSALYHVVPMLDSVLTKSWPWQPTNIVVGSLPLQSARSTPSKCALCACVSLQQVHGSMADAVGVDPAVTDAAQPDAAAAIPSLIAERKFSEALELVMEVEQADPPSSLTSQLQSYRQQIETEWIVDGRGIKLNIGLPNTFNLPKWEVGCLNPAFMTKERRQQLYPSRRRGKSVEQCQRELARVRKQGDFAPVLRALDALGTCYESEENWPEAEKVYREVLQLAEEHHREGLPNVHRALGMVYKGWGRYDDAEQMYLASLAAEFDRLTAFNLVVLYQESNQHQKAYELYFGPHQLIQGPLDEFFNESHLFSLLHTLTHCKFPFGHMEQVFEKAAGTAHGPDSTYEHARYYCALGLKAGAARLLRTLVDNSKNSKKKHKKMVFQDTRTTLSVNLLAILEAQDLSNLWQRLQPAVRDVTKAGVAGVVSMLLGNACAVLSAMGEATQLRELVSSLRGALPPLLEARARALAAIHTPRHGDTARELTDCMALYERHLPKAQAGLLLQAAESCADPFLHKAKLLEESQRWAEAEKTLRRCIAMLQRMPDHVVAKALPAVHTALANHMMNRGRPEEAQGQAEKARSAVRPGVDAPGTAVLKSVESRAKKLAKASGDYQVHGFGATYFEVSTLTKPGMGVEQTVIELLNGIMAHPDRHTNIHPPDHAFGMAADSLEVMLMYNFADEAHTRKSSQLWMTNTRAAVLLQPQPHVTRVLEVYTTRLAQAEHEDQLLTCAIHYVGKTKEAALVEVVLPPWQGVQRGHMPKVLKGMNFASDESGLRWSAAEHDLVSLLSAPGTSGLIHHDRPSGAEVCLERGEGRLIPYIPCAAACGARGSKTCGACRQVRYCGAACQKKHWPDHKAACKAYRQRAGPAG